MKYYSINWVYFILFNFIIETKFLYIHINVKKEISMKNICFNIFDLNYVFLNLIFYNVFYEKIIIYSFII